MQSYRKFLGWLTIGAVLAPIVVVVLLAFARLLGAMGDAVGAAVVDRVALAASIAWALDLVLLVVVLAVDACERPRE